MSRSPLPRPVAARLALLFSLLAAAAAPLAAAGPAPLLVPAPLLAACVDCPEGAFVAVSGDDGRWPSSGDVAAAAALRLPLGGPGWQSFAGDDEGHVRELSARLAATPPRELLLSLVGDETTAERLYRIKRISTVARAASPTMTITLLVPPGPAEGLLAPLAEGGAPLYVDRLGFSAASSPSPEVEATLLAAGWPPRRLVVTSDGESAASGWVAAAAAGAEAVLFECGTRCAGAAAEMPAAAAIRRALVDAGVEGANRTEAAVRAGQGEPERLELPAFVDPATLDSWVVLPAAGRETAWSFPGHPERKAERIDPVAGTRAPLAADASRRFRIPASPSPTFLRFGRGGADLPELQAEVTTVAASLDPTGDEIIARHRVRRAAIDRTRRTYIAENETSLRFRIGSSGPSIEIEILGPTYWNTEADIEWVWRDFLLNGVKWRGETVPELPLIQPDKVATPPLVLSFSEDYRYELLGRGEEQGRPVWIVRFEPGPAASAKSLFRGRAFVDRENYDLLRSEAVQTNPGGETLSNEEIVDYLPAPDGYPLPSRVRGQSNLLTAGSVTTVERETLLKAIRVNPETFETERQQSRASRLVMVKETEKGIRYLDKVEGAPAGTRQVREGRAERRTFGLAGVFADDAMDYPLPLLGVNYIDFNLLGKGWQTNIFFAGALITANLTNPRLFGTRIDVGADLFATAFASNEDVWVDGEADESQRVRTRPAALGLNAGFPVGPFGKAFLRYRYRYDDYSDDDETADDFVVPVSGATHGLVGELRFDRLGWQVAGEYGLYRRDRWEAWGRPDDTFDPDTKEYTTWQLGVTKEWKLPAAQRFEVDARWLDGDHLDRFSRYTFGFFGGTKVSGFKSGSVRTGRALVASATWGMSFASIVRFDLSLDHAIADDPEAGWDQEHFTGLGIGGNFNGPWETIVRTSVGVPLQGPESDGFVLFLAVLKLF